MTYCVAMRLEEGLMFVSDSRTNAGLDHIAVFRKLHLFGIEGERVIVLQSSGNLATSQSVITLLRERIQAEEEFNIHTVKTMYEAATLVGETLREVLQNYKEQGYGFFVLVVIGWANSR
jgi:putative proteasome-type protease